MNEQYTQAFNRWMDEYTNDPDAFSAAESEAIKHLKARLGDQEPTYGQRAAATFERYLAA
jgi:hypothetical protein